MNYLLVCPSNITNPALHVKKKKSWQAISVFFVVSEVLSLVIDCYAVPALMCNITYTTTLWWHYTTEYICFKPSYINIINPFRVLEVCQNMAFGFVFRKKIVCISNSVSFNNVKIPVYNIGTSLVNSKSTLTDQGNRAHWHHNRALRRSLKKNIKTSY